MPLSAQRCFGTMSAMKTIGLFLETNCEYGREFLKGVAQYAHERRNFQIKLVPYRSKTTPDDFAGCDGIIIRSGDESTIAMLKATGLPIVDAFCQVSDQSLIGIDSDHGAIAEMAARHFIGHGFKSFAFCGHKGTRYSDELESSFSRAVKRKGAKYSEFKDYEPTLDNVFVQTQPRRPNKAKLKSWLSKLPRHTAILCANDMRAYYVMQTCIAMGRAVPQDIAVMGVDNDTLLCLCAPVMLTSIDPRARYIGHCAARLVMTAITKPMSVKRRRTMRISPGDLYERDSTKVYPVDPPWFAKALAYIDSNMASPIQTREVAKAAGVSQTAVQNAFHRHFRTSAGKYILSVKMRQAKALLDAGDMMIKEIATATGFHTPAYFCRTFGEYYGYPPSASVGAMKH